MIYRRHRLTLLILILVMPVIAMIPGKDTMAAKGFDQVASGSDMASQKEVEKYGMVPIYGGDLNDGSYEITVTSSSPFFRIEKGVLNVKDGKMDATITMSSYSYDYIYMGTAEDAAKAEMSDYIKYKKQSGYYTFSFDVPFLNHKFDCAAFSNRKQKWYNRYILFDASSLEDGAIDYEIPDYDKIEKALSYYEDRRRNIDENDDSSPQPVTPDETS